MKKDNNLGQLLAEKRKQKGVSIRRLADDVGVSPTTINNMGKGKTTLDKVADALGVTIKIK